MRSIRHTVAKMFERNKSFRRSRCSMRHLIGWERRSARRSMMTTRRNRHFWGAKVTSKGKKWTKASNVSTISRMRSSGSEAWKSKSWWTKSRAKRKPGKRSKKSRSKPKWSWESAIMSIRGRRWRKRRRGASRPSRYWMSRSARRRRN